MAEHDAFWLARGAGRVKNRGQVVSVTCLAAPRIPALGRDPMPIHEPTP